MHCLGEVEIPFAIYPHSLIVPFRTWCCRSSGYAWCSSYYIHTYIYTLTLSLQFYVLHLFSSHRALATVYRLCVWNITRRLFRMCPIERNTDRVIVTHVSIDYSIFRYRVERYGQRHTKIYRMLFYITLWNISELRYCNLSLGVFTPERFSKYLSMALTRTVIRHV